MKEFPEGYPLSPKDKLGNKVNDGDVIRITVIPESLLDDYLSEVEKTNILSCAGKPMKITEIDEYGFVWVEMILINTDEEYISQSFSVEPEYVIKVQ